LFDRNGFAGTTLADVSSSAGVTKGAFYFHFTSKDELGGAVQAEACALLRSANRRAERGSSALQALVDLTHELVRWLGHEPLVRASFRTARECGRRGRPFLDFHTEWLAALDALLRDAEQRGELAAGVDVEHALTLVLSVSVGLEMLWWAKVRQGGMAESLTGMWSMLLPGLAKPGRRLYPAGSWKPTG
jgi:AcrR family transcriptional regulator